MDTGDALTADALMKLILQVASSASMVNDISTMIV